MERTLRTHMVILQERIQELNDKLTQPNHTTGERDCFKYQVELAQVALDLYLRAYDVELMSA
ncbi:MAG TPA: hypothetical protein VFW25_06670 [Silvibacterium sp.]|nr:hypothetical protein [Silvibacterium sp.]